MDTESSGSGLESRFVSINRFTGCSSVYGPGGASRVTPHGAARRVRGNTFVDSASATGTAAVFSVAVCFRCASPFLTGRPTRVARKIQLPICCARQVHAIRVEAAWQHSD